MVCDTNLKALPEPDSKRGTAVPFFVRLLTMSQEAWGAQSPNIDDPEYRVPNPQPWRSTRIEQLLQLFHGATWDGDLISKSDRKELVKEGLAIQQRHGYNLITCKGVTYLYRLGIIHP